MDVRENICQVVRDDISYSIASRLKGHEEIVRAVNRTDKYKSMYEIPLQGVREAALKYGVNLSSPDDERVMALLNGGDRDGEEAGDIEYSGDDFDPLASEETVRFGLDVVSSVWTWLEKGPEYWGNMRELEQEIDKRNGQVESQQEAYRVVRDSFGSVEDYLDQTEEFLTAGRNIVDMRGVMDVLEQQLPDTTKARLLQKTASAADGLLVGAYDHEIDRIRRVRDEYRELQDRDAGVY